MNKKPDFNVEAAHRYFSAHCFNSAWDLIDKTDRTPEEDERMVQLNQASMWHWSQRADAPIRTCLSATGRLRAFAPCSDMPTKRAAVGSSACSTVTQLAPFYLGYAYEALARAEQVAGNQT